MKGILDIINFCEYKYRLKKRKSGLILSVLEHAGHGAYVARSAMISGPWGRNNKQN